MAYEAKYQVTITRAVKAGSQWKDTVVTVKEFATKAEAKQYYNNIMDDTNTFSGRTQVSKCNGTKSRVDIKTFYNEADDVKTVYEFSFKIVMN